MRTVVFDLDGTLADTSGDLISAANVCLRDMGLAELCPQRDKATALRGGRAMLRLGMSRSPAGVDEARVDAYYPVLLDAYATDLNTHTHFFDGAIECVRALRAGGDRVVICTNKPHALAEQLMQNLGVRDLFDALIGADTLPTRKPDIAPYIEAVKRAGGQVERSCMIGDTKTDHDTARNAGVPSILVDFGPGDEDVHALKPEAILRHFNDLTTIVDRLLGA